VYDVTGREIAVLVNEKKQPGEYEVQWDVHKFASGIYYYQIIANEFHKTRKLVLIK
jgi:hypothetical protein